jgi:plasmid stabilization system protein ParE
MIDLTSRAQRSFLDYVNHLADLDEVAAAREGTRILDALERFSEMHVDGVICEIRGWPRPLCRHYIRPFKVYYERQAGGMLYVIRLHHYARRSIER